MEPIIHTVVELFITGAKLVEQNTFVTVGLILFLISPIGKALPDIGVRLLTPATKKLAGIIATVIFYLLVYPVMLVVFAVRDKK
jgi:hypothetical protein